MPEISLQELPMVERRALVEVEAQRSKRSTKLKELTIESNLNKTLKHLHLEHIILKCTIDYFVLFLIIYFSSVV